MSPIDNGFFDDVEVVPEANQGESDNGFFDDVEIVSASPKSDSDIGFFDDVDIKEETPIAPTDIPLPQAQEGFQLGQPLSQQMDTAYQSDVDKSKAEQVARGVEADKPLGDPNYTPTSKVEFETTTYPEFTAKAKELYPEATENQIIAGWNNKDDALITPPDKDVAHLLPPERALGGAALRTLATQSKEFGEREVAKEDIYPKETIELGRKHIADFKVDPGKDVTNMGSLYILKPNLQKRIEERYPDQAVSQKIKESMVAAMGSIYQEGERARGESAIDISSDISKRAEEVDPFALKAEKLQERSEKINKPSDSEGSKAIANFKDIVKSGQQGLLSFQMSKLVGTLAQTGDEEMAKSAVTLKNHIDKDIQDNAATPSGVTMKTANALANMLTPMALTIAKGAISGGALSKSDWMLQGGGDVFADLINAGVPHKTAKGIMGPTGFIYQNIENAVTVKGLSKPASSAIKEGFSKYLIRAGADKTVDALMNMGEEGVQGFTTSLATEIGKNYSGLDERTISEILKGSLTEGIKQFAESGPTMGVLSLIGLGKGVHGKFKEDAANIKSIKTKLEEHDFEGDSQAEAKRLLKSSTEDNFEENFYASVGDWNEISAALKEEPVYLRAIEELAGKKIDKIGAGEGIKLVMTNQAELESIYKLDPEYKEATIDNTTTDEQDNTPEDGAQQPPITEEVPQEAVTDTEGEVAPDQTDPEILIPEQNVSKAEVDAGMPDLQKEIEAETGEKLIEEDAITEDTETEAIGDIEKVEIVEGNIADVVNKAIEDAIAEDPESITPNQKEGIKALSKFSGGQKPQTVQEILNPGKISDPKVSEQLTMDEISGVPGKAAQVYATAHLQLAEIPYVKTVWDYKNLGGLNTFFEGNVENANGEKYNQAWAEKHPEFLDANGKAMKAHSAADIVFSEFWRGVREDVFSDDNQQAYRTGGDEGSADDLKRTEKEVFEAMNEFKARYDEKIREYGLQEIPHPKQKGMPLGVGFDFGVVTVNPGDNGFAKYGDADQLATVDKEAHMEEVAKKIIDNGGNQVYIIDEVTGEVSTSSERLNASLADMAKQFSKGEITEEQFKKGVSDVTREETSEAKGKGATADSAGQGSKPKQDILPTGSDKNQTGEVANAETGKDSETEKESSDIIQGDSDNIDRPTGKTGKGRSSEPKSTQSKADLVDKYKKGEITLDELGEGLKNERISESADGQADGDADTGEGEGVQKPITEPETSPKQGKGSGDGTDSKGTKKTTKKTASKGDSSAGKGTKKGSGKKGDSKLAPVVITKTPKKKKKVVKLTAKQKAALEKADLPKRLLALTGVTINDKGIYEVDGNAWQQVTAEVNEKIAIAESNIEMAEWAKIYRQRLLREIGVKDKKSPQAIVASKAWKSLMGLDEGHSREGRTPTPTSWTIAARGVADRYALESFEGEVPTQIQMGFPDISAFNQDDLIAYINEFAPSVAKSGEVVANNRDSIRKAQAELDVLNDSEKTKTTGESKDKPLLRQDEEGPFETTVAYGGSKNEEAAHKSLQSKLEKDSPISKKFKKTRRIDFIGEKATPQNIADLYTAHRDNKVEHFHITYVKDGKVVQHTSWSVGAPNRAMAMQKGNKTKMAKGAVDEKIRSAMKRLGADGYYITHNHPTGNTTPSGADITLTDRLNTNVPGFLGHIILNHNHASFLEANDEGVIKKADNIPYSKDQTMTPSTGAIVSSKDQAVAYMKENIIDTQGNGVIMFTNNANMVTNWRSLPKNLSIENTADIAQAQKTFKGLMQELKGNKDVGGIIIVDDIEQYKALKKIWNTLKGSDSDYVMDIIYSKDNELKSAANNLGAGGGAWKSRTGQKMFYEPALPYNTTSRKNLDNWHAGSVDDTKNPNGTPKAFYHGTTHTFSQFGESKIGNKSGWLGAGNYFTSNPTDASENYAGLGPDLTSRIEQRKEEIEGNDYDAYDFSQAMEISEEEAAEYFDDDILQEEGATLLAKKELQGEHMGAVMPTYVKLTNPLNISEKGETPVGIEVDTDYYAEMVKDEVERDDYEDEDEYIEALQDRARDAYYEDVFPKEDGNGVAIMESAENVLNSEDVPFVNTEIILSDLRASLNNDFDETIEDGVELWDFLKNALMDSQDPETGELNGNELARQIVEGAGFDGIIMDPMVFRMDGVEHGDLHVMAFNPNNVKSAIGNIGDFDDTNSLLAAEPSAPYKDSEKTELDIEPTYTIEQVRKIEHARLLKDSIRLGYLEAKIEKDKATLKDMREFLKLYIKHQDSLGKKMAPVKKKQLQLFVEKNFKVTDKGISNFKKAVVARIDKEIDEYSRKQVAKRLDNIIKKINSSRAIADAIITSDDKEVKAIEKLNEILTDDQGIQYVFSALSKKSKDELEKRRALHVSNEQLSDISDPWLQDALRRENATRIADLPLGKMLKIEKDVMDMLDTINLLKEVWGSEIYANYYADLSQAKENIENTSKGKKTNKEGIMTAEERKDSIKGIPDNLYGTGAVNTEDMAEALEGKDVDDERAVFGRVFFKAFDNALSKYLGFGQAAKDKMSDILTWKDIEKLSLFSVAKNRIWYPNARAESAERKFINEIGIDLKLDNKKDGDLKLAPDQIISLYLHSLNPLNKRAFMDERGGFTTSQNPNGEAISMTEDDFDRVHKIINSNKKLKQVADHISTELNTTNRAAIYNTSKELNFTPIEMQDMYFPIVRSKIYKDYLTRGLTPSDIASNNVHSLLEETGALKARNESARGIVVLEGAMESFIRSTNLAGAYSSYAKPLRTAKQLLADVKDDMDNALRGKEWQRFSNYVEEVSGAKVDNERPTTSAFTNVIKGIFGNLVPAALGMNPVVVARQYFSFPVIFSEIGAENIKIATEAYAELGVGSKKANELKEQLYKYSPQFRARIEGGYANVEMGEKAYGAALTNFFDKPKTLAEKQMIAISKADAFTVLRVANVAKKMVERDHPELTGDAKWEKIAHDAEKLIRRTQPMYTKEHRSAMARDKNVYMRMTFAFTSVTQRLYGQLHRAWHRFKNASSEDKPKALLRLIERIIWVDIMSALGMTLIDTLKDLLFGKEISSKTTFNRLVKYGMAPAYFGNQVAPLLTHMVESTVETGSPDIMGAFTSAEFGRSIDNIVVGFTKDALRAGGQDLPSALGDFKAGDIESALKRSTRSLDILQRVFTGLALGNAKKYTYNLGMELLKTPSDNRFMQATGKVEYFPVLKKSFSVKGKKYRYKKAAYNEMMDKVSQKAVQLMYTASNQGKLAVAKNKSEEKEVLKGIWAEASSSIKAMRNRNIKVYTIPVKAK